MTKDRTCHSQQVWSVTSRLKPAAHERQPAPAFALQVRHDESQHLLLVLSHVQLEPQLHNQRFKMKSARNQVTLCTWPGCSRTALQAIGNENSRNQDVRH